MDDALVERVEALERAVTDGDHDLSGIATEAEALDRLQRLEDDYDDLEARIAELEAATQALRGYVGNVRAVNEEVETRAETALSKVEALEKSVPEAGSGPTATTDSRSRDTVTRDQVTPENSRTDAAQTGQSAAGKEHSPRMRAEHGGKNVPRENGAGQEHCSACGTARRDEYASGGEAIGGDNGENEMPETDAPSSLRQSDPLVSDGAGEDASTLDRFKRLL